MVRQQDPCINVWLMPGESFIWVAEFHPAQPSLLAKVQSAV